MSKASAFQPRPRNMPKPQEIAGFMQRSYAKPLLLLACVVLLTLAYAPFGQFYLACVGLVPWLLAVQNCRTWKRALLWGWLIATLFFIGNMWWLAYVTLPGMVALMIILALYWAVAGLIIRATGVLDARQAAAVMVIAPDVYPGLKARPGRCLLAVIVVPAIWVGMEFLRGNAPFDGLPWLFLGHTQTPNLVMCQIADALGAYGVSFWVVMVNTIVALAIIHPKQWRRLLPAAATVGCVLLLVVAYGIYRFRQPTTYPGPQVVVVQPNFPQSHTGEKSGTPQEWLEFHLDATRRLLDQLKTEGNKPDLVVWSETMLPSINDVAREILRDTERGAFIEKVRQSVAQLTSEYQVALLAGGIFADSWREVGQYLEPADRRNSAYLFNPDGKMSQVRYDKVHLVPWGEYVPFRQTIPWLYRFFLTLSPYDYDYTLTAGSELTVFNIGDASSARSWRFVVPICFEDIDSRLVARMFRDHRQDKRAEFLVNITNDGWYKFNQMPQHLQVAVFRSIENRVPTARSVNTGISGFVDSLGRTHDLIAAGKTGSAHAVLQLDRRVTFYTRVGDIFAGICLAATTLLAAFLAWRAWRGNLGVSASRGR